MPSPPLPTVALAPPPSNLTLSERRAQRQRQRATLPSQLPSDLATPASLLFHSSLQVHQDARFLDPPLSLSSKLSSGGCRSGPASAVYYTRCQDDDIASVISAAAVCSPAAPTAVALPRLRSPLPPHHRYPSPAPSFASSVSTAASTSTCASASTTSTNTSTSSASTSASGYSKDISSFGHRRRKTITAADDPVLVIGRSDSAATVTPVFLGPPSTASITTTTTTTASLSKHSSRGRGRSISRGVRKVASVFNLLKREDAVSIPTVPELPTGYRSVLPHQIYPIHLYPHSSS